MVKYDQPAVSFAIFAPSRLCGEVFRINAETPTTESQRRRVFAEKTFGNGVFSLRFLCASAPQNDLDEIRALIFGGLQDIDCLALRLEAVSVPAGQRITAQQLFDRLEYLHLALEYDLGQAERTTLRRRRRRRRRRRAVARRLPRWLNGWMCST